MSKKVFKFPNFDFNFEKGVKAIGTSIGTSGAGDNDGWAPFISLPADATGADAYSDADDNNATIEGTNTVQGVKFINPPKVIKYSVDNTHNPDEVVTIQSAKAACVANRRVYIGNVMQNGVSYGDRMLKSPVNQFDKFPEKNSIDVEINDGEAITALVEYADRILQFKENTLYIINASQQSEFLESKNDYKGCLHPGAIAKTDFGVVCANTLGCFLYDGSKIINLIERGGVPLIKPSTWKTFAWEGNAAYGETYLRVGYDPIRRNLIVRGGNATYDNMAYMFDMVTKSWVFIDGLFDNNSGEYGNFANSPHDGTLLWNSNNDNIIERWDDTRSSTSDYIYITTKDIDFGNPSIKKNIHKVRISYKGTTVSTLTVKYAVSGDTDTFAYFNSDTTPLSNQSDTTKWHHAELVPSSSEATGCYSFKLHMVGTVSNDFEINDISIIYRPLRTV